MNNKIIFLSLLCLFIICIGTASAACDNTNITNEGQIKISATQNNVSEIQNIQENEITVDSDDNSVTAQEKINSEDNKESDIISKDSNEIINAGLNPDDVFVFPSSIGVNNTLLFQIKDLPADADGNFSVLANGTKLGTVQVNNGSGNIYVQYMVPGTYVITLTYTNDSKLDAINKSSIISVPKIKLGPDVFQIPSPMTNPATFAMALPINTTGKFQLYVDNLLYYETVMKNNIETITVYNVTAGNHNITLNYTGDKIYSPIKRFVIVTFPKVQLSPEIFQLPSSITNATPFGIKVPENAKGKFQVLIDDIIYGEVNITNQTGEIIVTNMKPGNHTLTLYYTGDELYAPLSQKIVTVIPKIQLDESIFKIPVNITNSSTFEIILPDNATGDFELKIDDKSYSKTRIIDSIAKINANIDSGKHNLTLIYSGDDVYDSISKSIMVIIPGSLINLTGVDLDVYYSGQAAYKVQVLSDGKNITDGTNITITFNGNIYSNKTVNGYVTILLPSDIKIGTYTVTANYNDITINNTVAIKNIIKMKLKTLKKSKKTTSVKVSLAKVDGKVLSGKKLTLKIKGKKVATAKTNKKGTGIFKIKKSKLKKFKKGKYTASAVYGKDVYSVKIKIK